MYRYAKKTLSDTTSDTLFANVGKKETALNLNFRSRYTSNPSKVVAVNE